MRYILECNEKIHVGKNFEIQNQTHRQMVIGIFGWKTLKKRIQRIQNQTQAVNR